MSASPEDLLERLDRVRHARATAIHSVAAAEARRDQLTEALERARVNLSEVAGTDDVDKAAEIAQQLNTAAEQALNQIMEP